MTFLSSLISEIADLEQKLSHDPVFIKLSELRKVRHLYESDKKAETSEGSKNFDLEKAVVESYKPDASRAGRRQSPERQEALRECRAFLESVRRPAKTAELYSYLRTLGVELGGKDPQNNLSALLYHSPDFLSLRGEGWILKPGIAQQSASQAARLAAETLVESLGTEGKE
ncbi:MAG: hypothetical protein P4L81_00550 [Candidatus Pacebacteria bacterium]|nr:hypothetical protein [Candidatus Paceibacterota bacterium]